MLAHVLCSLSVIHNIMLSLFIKFKEIEFKKSEIGCLFSQIPTCFMNPPMSGWRLSGSCIMLVTRRCATISSQHTLTGGTQAAVNTVSLASELLPLHRDSTARPRVGKMFTCSFQRHGGQKCLHSGGSTCRAPHPDATDRPRSLPQHHDAALQ